MKPALYSLDSLFYFVKTTYLYNGGETSAHKVAALPALLFKDARYIPGKPTFEYEQ